MELTLIPAIKHNKLDETAAATCTYFDLIPKEVRLMILSFVDDGTKRNQYLVSKKWFQDIMDDPTYLKVYHINSTENCKRISGELTRSKIQTLCVHPTGSSTTPLLLTFMFPNPRQDMQLHLDLGHFYGVKADTEFDDAFFASPLGEKITRLSIHLNTERSLDALLCLPYKFPRLSSVELYVYGVPDNMHIKKKRTLDRYYRVNNKLQEVMTTFDNVKAFESGFMLQVEIDYAHPDGYKHEYVDHGTELRDLTTLKIRGFQSREEVMKEIAVKYPTSPLTIDELLQENDQDYAGMKLEYAVVQQFIVSDSETSVRFMSQAKNLKELSIHFPSWVKPYEEQTTFLSMVSKLDVLTLGRATRKTLDAIECIIKFGRPKKIIVLRDIRLQGDKLVQEPDLTMWALARDVELREDDNTICMCSTCSSSSIESYGYPYL